MSAKWDRTQPIRFYYGNAAHDLSETLPPEDFTQDLYEEPLNLRQELSDIHELLDQATSHLSALKGTRREISFLLADLKRMIR